MNHVGYLGFNLIASFLTLVIVLMVLVNLVGVMSILQIKLNAISLVNLVMTVGISVEFCSHLILAQLSENRGK